MAHILFLIKMLVVYAMIVANLAHPLDDTLDELPQIEYYNRRYVRSLQPGAPSFPVPNQNSNGGWQISPGVSRGQDGNTRASVNVQHSGPNHDVNAQVNKVIRGPGKSKPSYSVHGSWRW